MRTSPWVPGSEQTQQLGLAAFVETLARLGEQPTRAVEGVVLAATTSDGLVLHASAALIAMCRNSH